MIGEYVMTEQDCLSERDTPESVGMGSYTADSHNVQRYVTPEGWVQNEGDVGVRLPGPYKISYRSLTPKPEEVGNLLVPVAVSASHIAFGSVRRMEPVFMRCWKLGSEGCDGSSVRRSRVRLGLPGVDDGEPQTVEVAHVAGDKGEPVLESRGGDLSVDAAQRSAAHLTHGLQHAPPFRDRGRHREYSA